MLYFIADFGQLGHPPGESSHFAGLSILREPFGKNHASSGSCFLYSSSAENRTKKKGSQQPSFLGNKNPNVSMGSQQGVFSQKRECFAGGRTCNLANFTLLSKMIHAWQPHCYAIRTSEWTSTCLRYQAEKRQCSCRRFPAFEPGLQLHGQLPRRKYPPGSLPCRR